MPLLALSIVATFGFSNQSVVIETAEDAVDAVAESQAVYSAVLSIGDERLHRVGADLGSLADLTEATDAALTDLEAEGSSATVEAVAEVRSLVEESRGNGVEGSEALLGAATGQLLNLETDLAEDYPSAESRNAAVVNRSSIEAIQLREWSWIAYLQAEEVTPQTIASLSADFATAKAAIASAQALDVDGGSTAIESVLQSGAGLRLAELETRAIDDLVEGELSVDAEEALRRVADFRVEWTAAIDAQGTDLQGVVNDELTAANDLRSLFTLLGIVGVVVLAGLIFVIYRSITNPLESLLERASSVANEELPSLVETLRHDDGNAVLPVAEPIPVTSHDEIGELVAAFNDVQSTAYDLATEQALGRRNVADMFVNLGRRNQQLLQRILAQLTELEQSEEDPDKLSDLFELDNVVTRMRRNAESLLALAGAQTARQWSQPIAIENTVRAAFGEVEGYERIDITQLDEVKVTGSVVADVTHLLAELLENSINFSEPHTLVEVTGRSDSSGYHVIVEDRGIGMSQRELEDNNSRITDPPPLDQVPTRFLGLYVVGRLAERHQIMVRLSETSTGGISAKVTLPPSLLVTAEDERNQAARRVVETQTSPLEEEHDLDAELASITEDLDESSESDSAESDSDELDGAESHHSESDSSDDYSDDDSSDDADEDLSPVDSDGPDALPSRSRKSSSATAVAEPKSEVATDVDTDTEDEAGFTVSDKVRETEDVSAESDEAPELEKRPVRKSKRANKAKTEKAKEAKKVAVAVPVEEVSEVDEVASAPAVADTGGLPVRNKGGALDQVKPMERMTVEDRTPTDTSEESAGNFSSMMSALSTGVARGLEESEIDESTEGNDE